MHSGETRLLCRGRPSVTKNEGWQTLRALPPLVLRACILEPLRVLCAPGTKSTRTGWPGGRSHKTGRNWSSGSHGIHGLVPTVHDAAQKARAMITHSERLSGQFPARVRAGARSRGAGALSENERSASASTSTDIYSSYGPGLALYFSNGDKNTTLRRRDWFLMPGLTIPWKSSGYRVEPCMLA